MWCNIKYRTRFSKLNSHFDNSFWEFWVVQRQDPFKQLTFSRVSYNK